MCRGTLLAVVIAGIALTGALLPATASAGTSSPMTPAQAAQAEATATAQCAKPLATRVGPWACAPDVVKTDAQRKAAVLDGITSGALTADATAVAASTGYCTYLGCWTNFTSSNTNFVGGGYYGYGTTTLGSSHLVFEVNIAGYGTTSKPFNVYTTRGTKNTSLSGERLYLSATYPGGKGVNGGLSYRTSPCGARAAYVSCQWAATAGFGTYENTAQKITISREASWTDPSSAYPGRWYFYAKSIIMNISGGQYVTSGVNLPATPALGGWKTS
jgi:hypothetical protein